jgi:phage tail-like protein
MNENEFKFLVINTQSLWQEGTVEPDATGAGSIEITEDGISLRKFYTHTLTERSSFGTILPVDFALDSCGLLYVLDIKKKKVAIIDTNTHTTEWAKCISFSDPRALTLDSYNLYVADGEEVYCFARANYQVRWKVRIEGGLLVDMALDSSQNLYVLDTNKQQVLKIDKTGNLSVMTLSAELEDAVNICTDQEGYLYVLERSQKQAFVLKFDSEGNQESPTSLVATKIIKPSGLAVDGQGSIFVGDQASSGTPYQIDTSGKASPVGYVGATYRLLLSKKGDLYILGEKEIAFLKLVERFIDKGTYITRKFDSAEPEMQWHKVVVDAEIPENTRMNVYYYISDAENLPDEPVWSDPIVNFSDALILSSQGEYIWFKIELISDDLHTTSPQIKSLKVYFPRLSYLRYLPATYQEDKTGRDFMERFLSLFETLFSNHEEAIGLVTRYIDSEATPYAFLPWLSSWLAIAYDENWAEEKIRELIKRAPQLYKMRGTRKGIEEIIGLFTGEEPIIVENFHLSRQEGKKVIYNLWQKAQQGDNSLLLGDTPDLRNEDVIKISDENNNEFAVISYIEGNILHLRGKIVSDYNVGATVEKARIEEVLYGDCPYSFCVLLKPSQVRSQNEYNAVSRIISQEKPAHTIGGLRVLQPWIYLDMHTYLGINTMLTRPAFILGESSVVSRETVLDEWEKSGQVDLRARLGVDTKLT